MRIAIAAFILFAVNLTACGSAEQTGETGTADAVEEGSDVSSDYRIVLGNAITDTLRGEASFGTVVEPETGNARFVIRLASDYDFAGGFIIARRDTTLPQEGSYGVDVRADSLAGAPAGEFTLFYREGMLRDMRAASGSLNLTTVTDTLIAGTFDVNLRGRTAGLDRSRTGSEVHAVGRFRAGPGLESFVIGL